MAYFEPYIGADGIHVPTYDDVMEYLTEQYKTIFGLDIYIGVETPDYQMLSVFAKCIDDANALAVQSYNDRNPNFAIGNSLDAIVALSGIIRKTATASTAVLTVAGTEGTVIPSGSKAIDEQGNTWTFNNSVTIPEGGETTVNATCDTLGAIITPSGTINGIYTPTSGWESVTNEAAATSGRDIETDAQLRSRFAESHAVTASGLTESLVGALLSVGGVDFVELLQNNTDSTDSNGIPAHTICAVVKGGDEDEIAETIYSRKAPGIGTYGSVTKTVIDPTGHSNTIKFTRPSSVVVSVTITIKTLDGYDSSRVDPMIMQSIIQDIESLGIGENWRVSMGYKDAYSAFAGEDVPFTITGISATNTHGTSTETMQCNYNEILTCDTDHITITVSN